MSKTYIYLGHGQELLNKMEDGVFPDIKKVLPGCTLSTIAESGLASDLRSVLNLCHISQTHPEMITNPRAHLNELK